MSTAIQKTDQFTDEQLDVIKRTICKGASNDQLALFVATARRLGLDPFARQIFAVKRGQDISIQVSIDGFRLVADRTSRYAPGRPTEYQHDDAGNLICATAYVKKYAANEWHDVGETAYLVEYRQTTNALWKTMPRVMLAKCAEARALRRAFPAELSGVYATEEMDQAQPATVQPLRVVTAPPAHAAAFDDSVIDAEVVDGPSQLAVIESCIRGAATLHELGGLVDAIKALSNDDRIAIRPLYSERRRELLNLEAAEEAV